MVRLPIDVEKSFHYSRGRTRVFRVLAEGPRYPAALARKARVDIKTLRWIMHGHPPRYRRERSLIQLGLVREVRDVNGLYFELTEAGRRVKRALVDERGQVL